MIGAHLPELLGGTVADLEKLLVKVPAYLDEVTKIVEQGGKYITTIAKIAEDPALPQIVARIEKLDAIERAQKAAQRKAAPAAPTSTLPAWPTVPDISKGIGLTHYVRPLDAVIVWRQHPWLPWVVGAGAVVLLVGGGILIGRATKRERRRS